MALRKMLPISLGSLVTKTSPPVTLVIDSSSALLTLSPIPIMITWTGRSGSAVRFNSASSCPWLTPLLSSFLPSVNSTIELTRPGCQSSCTAL